MVELLFFPNDIVMLSIIFQLYFFVFAALSKSFFQINPAKFLSGHPPMHIDSYKKFYRKSNQTNSQNWWPWQDHAAILDLVLRHKAWGSVLLSKLQPFPVIDVQTPNCHVQKHLKDLVAIRVANAAHRGWMMKSMFFTLPTILNKELYCLRNCFLLLRRDAKN